MNDNPVFEELNRKMDSIERRLKDQQKRYQHIQFIDRVWKSFSPSSNYTF